MIAPTKPVLPNYEKYIEEIKPIWQTGMMTNGGEKHKKFGETLKEYISSPNVELFVNGHSALLIALKALGLKGEVITSPFTFISTTNAIVQAGLTPVFCDIDESYNINAEKLEALITDKTSAVVAPHIFGIPCDVEKIQKIADKHNLKVVYDAAQAFGTKVNGRHIVSYGDVSMVSFHATKVFNSIEGGMLVFKDASLTDKFARYRNFGIDYANEDVDLCGYNAKMNEFQAAMGIVNLPGLEEEIDKRKTAADFYAKALADIKGVTVYPYDNFKNVRFNHAYFPILINETEYGITRDELWKKLKEQGISTRKLYNRLTSDMKVYKDSGYRGDTPNAKRLAAMALDLPIYGSLTSEDMEKIVEGINKK